MGEIILQATNVCKSYSNGKDTLAVLSDLSISVFKNDIVTIMGKSGSGKSTILNILGTLDNPDSGIIQINGININEMSESSISKLRNQGIGFVFQFHHLLPEFTAIENVLIPTWIGNHKNKESYAKDLFNTLDLIDRINYFPNQLSGGERSRVSLIRAIINKPSLLFADEPTGNLDEKNSITLMELLTKINNDFNQTIILTTHNPEVAFLCNRKYTLENGLLHD